jgi:hypothetical protein
MPASCGNGATGNALDDLHIAGPRPLFDDRDVVSATATGPGALAGGKQNHCQKRNDDSGDRDIHE